MSSDKERDQIQLKIAVPAPVKRPFTYTVPEDLAPLAQVGCRVLVPFHHRKMTGYILEKEYQVPADDSLKPILEVLDTEPLFHESLVPFFEWVAQYYIYPIGQVIRLALPGGLNADPIKTGRLTDKGRLVLDSLSPRSEERKRLVWIRDHPDRKIPWPFHAVSSLETKGWVTIQIRKPRNRTGPLLRKFIRMKKNFDPASAPSKEKKVQKPKNEQAFFTALSTGTPVLQSDLNAMFANASYLIRKWTERGALEGYTGPVYRDPAGKVFSPIPAPDRLYGQQKRALNEILAALEQDTFSAFLLYGVTGSGKTEVYFRALEKVIEAGRQAIIMVPEISLVVYMENFFRSRLGQKVAVYHSGLGRGERYDQWMRMSRGEVDLVVGARSALFAPLPDLGLIIVDEEHDEAYKQENSPCYQARDSAVLRARLEKIPVILGSGTPSVQSFHNSVTGRYKCLRMPERVEKRPLPKLEIVDMKALEDVLPKGEILSPKLSNAIEKNLEAGNQTILFLNRRGFHRLHLCQSCGQTVCCPNCDVTLIHHLKEEKLTCHYCGFKTELTVTCPKCGRGGLKAYGFGTQKLEKEIAELFPDARIARMDADSTRKKGQAFHILKAFGEHKTDILLGTQMITKGYDFPMVTLVGVIAADFSLCFPDFRAGERTFQILSQVAGRSGRGSQEGKVIIQTFNPEHYAITMAVAHDYGAFFDQETALRKPLGYPPYTHLACLRLKGNSQTATADAAVSLSGGLKGLLKKWPRRGKEIQILGPVEAPLSKLKGKYRWQILIKGQNISLMQHLLTEMDNLVRKKLQSEGVHLTVDVDPYQML